MQTHDQSRSSLSGVCVGERSRYLIVLGHTSVDVPGMQWWHSCSFFSWEMKGTLFRENNARNSILDFNDHSITIMTRGTHVELTKSEGHVVSRVCLYINFRSCDYFILCPSVLSVNFMYFC